MRKCASDRLYAVSVVRAHYHSNISRSYGVGEPIQDWGVCLKLSNSILDVFRVQFSRRSTQLIYIDCAQYLSNVFHFV